MDRSVQVILDETFTDQYCVFEVVASPGHKGDQDIPSQCQLSLFGTRAIGKHLAFLNRVTFVNQGLLIDTGVLIGAFELGQLVNIHTCVLVLLSLFSQDTNDDPFGVDAIHDS